MNLRLIERNYDLKVSDLKLLDKHFGTEIYVVEADTKRYIVKVLPLYYENIDNEGCWQSLQLAPENCRILCPGKYILDEHMVRLYNWTKN